MDVSKLSKAELEQILNDVVDATVDELVKGEIMAGGPTMPDHAKPNLCDDFDESDKVAEKFGATAKAEEEDEEDEEEEKDKKAKECDAAKSNTESADLVKSQMKGMLDLTKTVEALNAKIDAMSKGRARDRKSAITEQEVEVIEKANKGNENNSELIKSNKKAFAKALCDLQAEGKVAGKYVTEFELFGERKIPDQIKKSVLQKADLLK